MPSPNFFFTIAGGAFPGRNPGNLPRDAYLRAASFSAVRTASTGTETSSNRSTPSLFFVVISIFIGLKNNRGDKRAAPPDSARRQSRGLREQSGGLDGLFSAPAPPQRAGSGRLSRFPPD